MKTVKSSQALRSMALARGASTSIGKDKFNSAMEKVKPTPKPEPKVVAPEPIKEPEKVVEKPEPRIEFKPEIIVQDVMPAVQASIDAFAANSLQTQKSNSAVMEEIQKAISKLSEPKSSPEKWRLTVNRDTRGILQSIDVTKS